MKVTGYKIQHTLRDLEQAREVLSSQFTDNVVQFESQAEKLDLREVFASYTAIERKIANLQTAQALYNAQVSINVLGEQMSLLSAVKLVGGAGRAEKMWKDAVKSKNTTYSRYGSETRSKDQEYAVRAISVKESLDFAKQASRVAGSLREAIQTGNATEIELALDEGLFA